MLSAAREGRAGAVVTRAVPGSGRKFRFFHQESRGGLLDSQSGCSTMARAAGSAWLLAPTATVIFLTTLISCYLYAIVSNAYIGGIPWPYISDTGREAPMYYVFAVGCTTTALLLAAVVVIYWRLVYVAPSGMCCSPSDVALGGVVCTVVASICLVLLACLSTIEYADAHAYSAYVFFVAITVAMVLFTVADRGGRAPGALAAMQRAGRVRLGVLVFYAVAFVVYLPVGLAVNCAWERFSTEDCLAMNLGADYCASIALESSPGSTKLWNYGTCPSTNLMRSVSQFLCVVCIILYFGATMGIDIRAAAAVEAPKAANSLQ